MPYPMKSRLAAAGLEAAVLVCTLAWRGAWVFPLGIALFLVKVDAHAQAAPGLTMADTAASSVTFPIKGFAVTGENPLRAGEAERVLAPFIRTDASLDTLQKSANALEAVLRDQGFGLYRVVLPPQQVSDTVTLNIVRFTLGTVTLQGNRHFDESNIRRSVPELQEGATPNFQRMAVQTAIANENQGKQIQIAMKESAVQDKIDANVVVKETRPWQGAVTISNVGNVSTGRDRVTVAAGHSNLFNRDQQLSAAYTTSLEQTQSVKQVGLSYRAPLYDLRSVVGISYTRSDVVGNFGSFNSTGAGRTAGVNYSHYLAPNRGYRSYVSVGLDDKQFDVSKINGVPLVGQLVRRSRQLSLGYVGRYESDVSVGAYNAEWATNLPGGEGNSLAAYQSEDPRITSARWNALRANGNYATGFAGNWLLGVRGSLQFSPNALISGEQLGLGGAASVRGTSERPIAGDRGLLGTLEVTTPELATGLRALGFVDAGWLSNNNPNATTKPSNDQLRSVGLGLRYSAPAVSVSADYGRVVTGSAVPLSVNSLSPQKGDQKLHLNLTARF